MHAYLKLFSIQGVYLNNNFLVDQHLSMSANQDDDLLDPVSPDLDLELRELKRFFFQLSGDVKCVSVSSRTLSGPSVRRTLSLPSHSEFTGLNTQWGL